MSESSERIRAALSRSGANRAAGKPVEPEQTTKPSVAVSEEVLAELWGSEPVSSEPAAEVETTLPMITASDEDRAGVEEYEDTDEVEPEQDYSAELPEPEPEEEVQARLRLIASNGEAGDRGLPRTLLAIAAGVILVAGVSAFLLRDRWLPSQKTTVPAVASFPLQLAVEPQGNGLMNIRWNPQSASVLQAREGRLVVVESGQQPRIIALEPAQLKIGHVYYQSPAERLEFRLEVVETSGAKAEESVLALSSGLTPAPPVDAPATKVESPLKVETKVEPPPVVNPPETPQPSRPAARQFTLPPQQSAPQTGPTILPDLPTAVPSGSVVPPGVALPETVNRIPVATPQVKEAPRPIRVGGNIQTANLIKKVAPVYPSLAKAARIQGTVRFTATIGKNGAIQNLQLISGPGMLVQAATDAVKQWVYRPMLLNGEPVEVITQLEVVFSLNQ